MTIDPGHPTRLDLALGERSYEILIGRGLLASCGERIRATLKQPRVFIVTDANVAPLYLETVTRSLSAAGIASESAILPAGEATKSFAQLEQLLRRMLQAKVERRTTLLALGGGVIGDLAGFAAAVLLRGVDFIQLPTTLLAQVDSSVGGKTGIDLPEGKNLVGAFHQPRTVLADIGALDSLPRRELLAGYAEVAKYGLLGDADFFAWLEGHGAALIAGDAAARAHAVATSCKAKAAIVAADERESGARALLNLGHTFAHALETECGYESGRLLHGEAVAIGLCLAFDLSAALGHCSGEDAARLQRHLAAIGLPTSPHYLAGADWSAERLIAHMQQDKKVKDGRLTFILARGIGKAFVTQEVAISAVRDLLTRALAG